MKIAVYWGCKIPTSQYAYEMSVRQVFPYFDVELFDLSGASCCGGPVRNINSTAALYLGLRNMALAHKDNFEGLLVPCNECHFMISEAKYRIDNDEEMQRKMQALLSEENLEYSGDLKIWHVIDLLHDKIGVDAIKSKVKKVLKDLKFAAHPGCQIIRPSEIGRVDDSERPSKLENLIKALGAETVEYSEKLDCCGAALLYSHVDTALSLAGAKLKAIQSQGVDGLVDTCPYCHIMYDVKQNEALAMVGSKSPVSVLYYTQLLGIALGIEHEKLGLHLNQNIDRKIMSE